ncbi:MAG: hypothetical protein HQL72_10035 [Magnetococcales bacterium]|nr:hypothetical protein [Magnetococcales bacterium]
MRRFKRNFGPVALALSTILLTPFFVEGGEALDPKPVLGVGESVLIPLSDRDPATLKGGGANFQQAAPSHSPSFSSSTPTPSQGSTPLPTPSAGAANNRFWAPPPDFKDDDGVKPGEFPPDSTPSVWSPTPPSEKMWGTPYSQPRWALEGDSRFDYSEPEPLPGGRYGDEEIRIRGRKVRPPRDPWKVNREDGYDQSPPPPRGSIWSEGTEPIRPRSKDYDPFDYGDVDRDFPKADVPYGRPKLDYDLPYEHDQGLDSGYRDPYPPLQAPPEGTYGNQWR